MATNFFPRRSPSRYSLILVSLLTLVGILGGCGPSSTTGPSHPGGLTPTLTPTRQLKGTISEFPLIPGYQPGTITAGPDGALWFTEVSPNAQNGSTTLTSKIERITPSGTISEFPLASNTLPKDITTGPDGALWFTEMSSYPVNESIPTGKIGRITPAGHISEFPVPTGDSNGLGILGITTGPDGNLWFTESGKIGRITPSGTISEFLLPTSNSISFGITAGSDGALWFTEWDSKIWSGKIGRLA